MMPRCRMNLSTMTFLLILQGAVVVLFCGWYLQLSPCGSASSNGKVHILLLTSWRSGSHFTGQVLSQHPSVFYLAEPVWHVWTWPQKPRARLLRMAVRDMLRSIFQCDFSVMEAYLPESHSVSSLFLWTLSRALCSPPACMLTPRNQISSSTQCYHECQYQAQGLQRAEAACNTYSHMAMKVVRMLDVEALYPLLQNPNLDLRIIHLVRDPRAVFRSREQSAEVFVPDSRVLLEQRSIPDDEVPYRAMQEICSGQVRINERAILNPPPFLKGRYKMIRYEDMARNPLEEINAMYKFVGLEMTPKLGKWIYQMTHGKGRGSAFGVTSRNATAVSQAWRPMLPHSQVQRIQEVCKDAMSLFGYRTVNSEEEQKRLDIDTVMPLEPEKFS